MGRDHRLGFLACGLAVVVGCTNEIDNTGPTTTPIDGDGQSSGSYQNDPRDGATRPPPTITNVTPLAGDYGTLVTITGDNLDEGSAALVLGGTDEDVTIAKPSAGEGAGEPSAIVTKWTKTEIQFRYPFPADGAVGIRTRSGQARGGTFVPRVRPGVPASGKFSRRDMLAIVSPAPGTVVAAFDGEAGPYLLVATGGDVRATAFPRGSEALRHASLFVTASGDVEGLFVAGDDLWHLTDVLGTPKATDTGIPATHAAGGSDETGTYAWIKMGTTLSRHRAPTWNATGETVADPTPNNAPGTSLAVGPEHSLYAAWGVNDGGSFPLYDHTTRPVMRRLRPGQTVFDAQKSAGGSADDYMTWTRLRPGPNGLVTSYFCASDTGVFSGASTVCRESFLGGVPASSYEAFTDYVVGYDASEAFVAGCEATSATIKVGPEADTSAQRALLFPCPSILAVAASEGRTQVLVDIGGKIFAPRGE